MLVESYADETDFEKPMFSIIKQPASVNALRAEEITFKSHCFFIIKQRPLLMQRRRNYFETPQFSIYETAGFI
jgi:hypothetical protein